MPDLRQTDCSLLAQREPVESIGGQGEQGLATTGPAVGEKKLPVIILCLFLQAKEEEKMLMLRIRGHRILPVQSCL